jgi:hypothetical protein
LISKKTTEQEQIFLYSFNKKKAAILDKFCWILIRKTLGKLIENKNILIDLKSGKVKKEKHIRGTP